MKLCRKGENIPYLKNREIGGALAAPASHFGPFANLFQTGAGRGVNEKERKKERKNGTEAKKACSTFPHLLSPFLLLLSNPNPPTTTRAVCGEDDDGPRGNARVHFFGSEI